MTSHSHTGRADRYARPGLRGHAHAVVTRFGRDIRTVGPDDRFGPLRDLEFFKQVRLDPEIGTRFYFRVVSFLNMVARDTSVSAARLQDEIHRRFSPAERLQMAFEMSEFARSLSRAGLRKRCPELSESELDDEMLMLLYGFRRRRT